MWCFGSLTERREMKDNHLFYLFSKNWQYCKNNRKNIVIFWILFVFANVWDVVVAPMLWASIINIIQVKGITQESFRTLSIWLSVLIFSSVFFWSFHGPARVLEVCNAFIARRNYREELLRGVMNLPLDWHTEHHSGDTIDKIEKGTSSIFNFSKDSFQIIYSVVQLLGSIILLVYFCPDSFFIILFFFLLSVWITIRFDRVLITRYEDLNKSENEISRSVFDALSNITTVVVLRVERLVFESIMRKVDEPYDLAKNTAVLCEWKWFLTAFCCRLMNVSVLVLYFYQHIGAKPGILVGEVYLLFQYLIKVSDIFFSFTSLYGDILIQRSRVSNAEVLRGDFVEVGFSNHILPRDWHKIEINYLTFSYPNTEVNHLDNISMSINRGERIAFVGETGSGKTTMLKVMRDLYHPQNLELIVDGKNVDTGFDGIARAISLIPQASEIFASTVRENITLGAEYRDKEIRLAMDTACFSSVADSLPKGLDSSTKERGVSFSGGQNQRLALARGILASMDKDIVLLDEPTSSLDPETEISVYENIVRLFNGKTIISTIHKFNLLSMFDVIYVFDRGNIVGAGSIAELRQNCPKFSSLWDKYVKSMNS